MIIAGVDEVGRGPLVGNVVAGAVILDPNKPIDGLTDSKKLSEVKRNYFNQRIKEEALAWAIGFANVSEIDSLNIFHASLLAMQRAVAGLTTQPEHILVDGKHCPEVPCKATAIIKGDLTEPCISAASIIAKVARDDEMYVLHEQYPQYGFAQHKGYPTKAHLNALQAYGPCEHHRRSYKPVQRCLEVCE